MTPEELGKYMAARLTPFETMKVMVCFSTCECEVCKAIRIMFNAVGPVPDALDT